MDENEPTYRLDQCAHVFTREVIGCDWGADGDAAVFRNLGGDVADAADINVAVFLGEAELGGEMLPDEVAVEHRDRAAADFEKFGHEHIGDGGFAAPGKSTEENGEALLVAGRETATQFHRHFREGEPARNVTAFVEAVAQLGPGEVEDAGVFRHFVRRKIFILIFEVDHHLEGHNRDADVGFVFLEKLLRFVGAIEWLAVGVVARAGVVATDDEMGAAVVFADERVPDGFARAAHTHGEGHKGELGGPGWIFSNEELVAADAGKVIDIAGPGHADDRMDEETGFDLLRGAEGEFDMRAVHWVASLEGDDAAPTLVRKFGTKLGRGLAEGFEVVVARKLEALKAPADVPWIAPVHQIGNAGVGATRAVEDGFALGLAIGLPDVFDVQNGNHDALGVAQRDFGAARLEGLGEGFRHIEGNRDRPKDAVAQAQLAANAFVIGLIHEAGER